MDRLTMQDVDGDGEEEPVLLFQEGAYRYLVPDGSAIPEGR